MTNIFLKHVKHFLVFSLIHYETDLNAFYFFQLIIDLFFYAICSHYDFPSPYISSILLVDLSRQIYNLSFFHLLEKKPLEINNKINKKTLKCY